MRRTTFASVADTRLPFSKIAGMDVLIAPDWKFRALSAWSRQLEAILNLIYVWDTFESSCLFEVLLETRRE
jgi:hypothetical protein